VVDQARERSEAAAEAARINAERETQKLGALDGSAGAPGIKLPGDP